MREVGFTFASIMTWSCGRKDVRAQRRRLRARRWPLNRSYVIRTWGRKNLRRMPRILCASTIGNRVLMSDQIVRRSIVPR